MGSNTETPTQVAYPKQSLCLHQFQTFWGESEASEETGSNPGGPPKAQEVDDWIVVGGTPKDFQEKRESKPKTSPKSSQRGSKQHLHSMMFGDGSSGKNSSIWNKSTMSGCKTKCTNKTSASRWLETETSSNAK